jgi:CRP/FNR family cyclic AMP-dependent transcriptional regulator
MIENTVAKIDIFKDLNKWQIDELMSWMQRKEYGAGEEIFSEGQLPDGLYLLCQGRVAVSKSSSAGKMRLADIEAPSFFGEMGLLNSAERSAGIKAVNRVLCGLLASDLFEAKLKAHNLTAHMIALNIGRLVSARLRDTNKKLATQTAIMAKRRAR